MLCRDIITAFTWSLVNIFPPCDNSRLSQRSVEFLLGGALCRETKCSNDINETDDSFRVVWSLVKTVSDDLRNNMTDHHKLWQPWHKVKGTNFCHRMAGSQVCNARGSSRCYTAVGFARFQASSVNSISFAFVLKFTQRRMLVCYRRFGTTCQSYLLGSSLGQLYPWRWDQ